MFKKAERKALKAKVGLSGPSGSGKTFSALRMATGLAGKDGRIAVADAENGRANCYADKFSFDEAAISPPYTTDKYIKVIEEAEKAGYDCLIVDGTSHAWAGVGGLLQQKEKIDSTGKGNQYTNWGKISPKQEALMSAILQADIHIIATIRSKQAYVLQENQKGKQAPVKVGLAPIQREGIEYEFLIFGEISLEHITHFSKNNTDLFGDFIGIITEEHGEEIAEWCDSGKQLTEAEIKEKKEAPLKNDKLKTIKELAVKLTKGFNRQQKTTWMISFLRVDGFGKLNEKSLDFLDETIATLNGQVALTNKGNATSLSDDPPF